MAFDVNTFWARVAIPRDRSACWEWMAATDTGGYGCFKADGKLRTAHRFSWSLANGPISPGKVVRHSCDNRRCVNPEHLLVGTQTDNVADMDARGRRVVLRGESHGMAKLAASDVAAMKRMRAEGQFFYQIADHFRVSTRAAFRAIKGESWREQAPT